MAGETVITVVGNLTADPELRYTQNGLPVANFTIATTRSLYDKQSRQYVDDPALFQNCSAWGELAENIAESLTKGTAVLARGFLKVRQYEDRDGNRRTAVDLEVTNVGPSLRRATTKVTRAPRSGHTQPSPGPTTDEQPY